jgi:hypothetical protein
VHNQPRYKEPLCKFDLYIEHFGYLFSADKELSEKKFKRTSAILVKELEKNPDDIYYRFQLARSSNAHGNKEKAFCEIRKAYKLISRTDEKTKRLYSFIYCTCAQIYCENKEFKEALNVCKEGISVRNDLIDLYYFMAYSLVKLEMSQDAVPYYLKYLDLVENYENLSISADRSAEIYYMDERYRDTALTVISGVFYNKADYNEAYKYICKVSDLEEKVPLLIKILLKLEKYHELKDIFEEVKENQNLKISFVTILENSKKNLAADKNRKIEALLAQGTDIYSVLNKIRISEPENKEELVKQAINVADFNDLPDFYSEILCGIDKNPRQVFLVLKNLRKSKIKQFANYLLDKYGNINDYLIEYLTKENIRDNDYQSLKTYISIAGLMLFKEAGKVKNQERDIAEPYYDIFKLYINRGIKYVNSLYNVERLRLYYNTIEDDEDRFFIALHYAIEASERNDARSGIKYFMDAVKACPYMGCFMNVYKDELFINDNNDNL